jgi:ribosomal protein S18 acetylase RimI-like enzyme
LWLDEDYRGRGLGSDLLRQAERQAVARGCRRACLSSFSFQAPDFYLRQGYEIFGQLEDYPDGETLFFLRKVLS